MNLSHGIPTGSQQKQNKNSMVSLEYLNLLSLLCSKDLLHINSSQTGLNHLSILTDISDLLTKEILQLIMGLYCSLLKSVGSTSTPTLQIRIGIKEAQVVHPIHTSPARWRCGPVFPSSIQGDSDPFWGNKIFRLQSPKAIVMS